MSRHFHVVSPHLDDAALSCTRFLAANPGSCLTTVFAAGPASVNPLTPWDRAAKYFEEGADVTAIRRQEDRQAAALVHASARHLTYWDGQYRNEYYGYDGPADQELAQAIAGDLLRPCPEHPVDAWVIPLGLGHTDHRLTADAGLLCARMLWAAQPQGGPPAAGHGPPDMYVYEELPYAVEDSGATEARKHDLAGRGFALEEDRSVKFLDDLALKRAVFRCHVSQQRPLRWRARKAIRTPERIWRLAYR
jgi:LmbE family N-acetylglucosaminyl deacetylase